MTNDSKTKKCTKCGEELPESKFHKNCKAKDGLHHQCKSCQNETTRKYYQANIKEIRQKQKEYYDYNRKLWTVHIKNYRIYAISYIESWTQYDVEVEARKYWEDYNGKNLNGNQNR
jgi:hypothetical protein